MIGKLWYEFLETLKIWQIEIIPMTRDFRRFGNGITKKKFCSSGTNIYYLNIFEKIDVFENFDDRLPFLKFEGLKIVKIDEFNTLEKQKNLKCFAQTW